jgi:PHD/YefM family antitoxin component YafN of YafNO toxin-antitoxin module
MWRVCKEAGRPWPVLCPEDDVIDYMVMEAVYLKVQKQDERHRKDAERRRQVQEAKTRLTKEFG